MRSFLYAINGLPHAEERPPFDAACGAAQDEGARLEARTALLQHSFRRVNQSPDSLGSRGLFRRRASVSGSVTHCHFLKFRSFGRMGPGLCRDDDPYLLSGLEESEGMLEQDADRARPPILSGQKALVVGVANSSARLPSSRGRPSPGGSSTARATAF
jgi:hypothetical protein